MATRQELFAEAARRGLLSPEKQAAFEEAQRRGLFDLKIEEPTVVVSTTTNGTDPTLAERFPELRPGGARGAVVSEPLLAVGTSIVAEPVSGIAGLLAAVAGFVGGLVPGGESPKEKALRFGTSTIEATQEALTFQPRTRIGAAGVEAVGRGAEFLTEQVRKPIAGIAGLVQLASGAGIERAAETIRRTVEEGIGPTAGAALERAGAPPIISTAAEVLPTAIATAAGVKAPIRRVKVAEPGPSIVKPTVTAAEGPAISVGRPRLDEPVDITPRISSDEIVTNLRKGKTEAIATEVVPDVQVIEAAQRLGVDLNVEHYATNTAFQDVTRALKSRPGSELLAGEVKALRDLATRADDLVTEIGGALDKGAISDNIINSIRTTIDDLSAQADTAYTAVREAIPIRARIETTNIKEFLDTRVADLGGDVTLLSTVEQRLLKIIKRGKDGTITYGALDRVRRDVGEGFSTRSGPFANDSQRVLREVYDVLSDTQNSAAEAFGVGDIYTEARGLVARRKGIEDQAVQLFGRDAAGSLVPRIRASAAGLPKGDITAFNKLIDALPEARRGEVSATVLGELFAGGSRQGGQLGTGFAKTWLNLNRNKSARNTLLRHLPAEARQRFDDIGRVMNAIVRSNAKSLANPSGSAGPIIAALEQGTIATKLYGAGQAVAGEAAVGFVGGIPGLSTVLRMTRTGGPNVSRVARADEFLTSQTFKDAVQAGIEGDIVRANRIAENSPQFKRWFETLDENTAANVTNTGFIGWLSAQDQQENR